MANFVCGVCNEEFENITLFVDHKKKFVEVYNSRCCDKMFHSIAECRSHELQNEINKTCKTAIAADDEIIKMPSKTYDEEFSAIENENDLNIILTTDKEDVIDACSTSDNNLTFKLYVCKVCSSFSSSYDDILKHIGEAHKEDNFNPASQISEIISELQTDLKKEDETKMNVTVVADVQPKKQRGRPRKKDSGDSKKGYSWLCSNCNSTFNKKQNLIEHKCTEVVTNVDLDNNLDLGNTHYTELCDDANSSDSKPKLEGNYGDETDINEFDYDTAVPVKPIFQSNDQRIEFEKKFNEFDFKFLDDMFMKESTAENPDLSDQSSFTYSCNTCKKVFKLESQVRLHCLTHTGLKPFKCTECEFSCNVKANLLSHMRRHTGNMYKCPKCTFESCNRTHVMEHLQAHMMIKCKCIICENFYRTTKSLIHHIRKSHCDTKEGKEYLSTFVGKGRNILFQCHICNQKFKSQKEKNRHLQVHKSSGSGTTHNCKFCDYKTPRPLYLKNHYRKHSIVYVCALCNNVELSTARLRDHLEDHLNIPSDDSKITDLIKQNSSIGVPDDVTINSLLEICISKSWYLPLPGQAKALNPNIYILEELVNDEKIRDDEDPEDNELINKTNSSDKEHLISDPIKAIGYKPLTSSLLKKIKDTFGGNECTICGRLFRSSVHLERHFHVHVSDKPFKCSSCDYSSSTKENLKKHEEVAHEGKTFLCDICNAIFKSRTTLWKHKHSHLEAEIECKKCDEKFNSKHKLKQHLIDKHPELSKEEAKQITGLAARTHSFMGRQSYKCPHCNRLFHGSHSDLQKHLWIHEGVKPFKCPVCPHATRSRNNLTAHMVRHCGFKPFLCEDCGKSYKSKSTLLTHIKTHKHSDRTADKNQDSVITETFNSNEDNHNQSSENILTLQEEPPIQQEIDCLDYSVLTDPKICENEKSSESLTFESVENLIQLNARAAQQIEETNETVLDERTAVSLIQQIVQQGALLQSDQSTVSENGQQTFIVADGSKDGKKFVIQYITDDNS